MPDTIRTRTCASLADIPAAHWDPLVRDNDPFTSYAYLMALEHTGQIGPNTRWQPRYVIAEDQNKRLIGALPLFLKHDSWGEFVFDFSWANAYEQAGGQYYPKLVTAVPYTPVGGRRLLIVDNVDRGAVADALIQGALAEVEATGASSWHVQFCTEEEREILVKAGLHGRADCQFHWFNQNYRDFDHYLESFRSSRRKKTRRERRRMQDQGIHFTTRSGRDLDANDWSEFYGFYASSFLVRGREPYFSADLFPRLAANMGDQIMVKTAYREDRAVAAALFFHNERRLYGRYWGCSEFVDALHFETCYYQGIDYCIEHGLEQFDPGTQGEHKIARGFGAHASYSVHHFRDPRFGQAVADYLRREATGVKAYMGAVDDHLPFRNDQGES
ncbi:MAG: GNAT family N-acetyltransferase [Gammaproteobacteria bacterium]